MAPIISVNSPRQLLTDVGRRLQQLRISRRMTQEDLALAAGISVRTLRRLESEGDARVETLVRVAIALRVEHQFAGLFAPEETRSLDEMLKTPRRSMRVRKAARR